MTSQQEATLTFAIVRGGVSEHEDGTETFTASFTPAKFSSKPGEKSHGCVCDIEVLETNLALVTAMLDAGTVPYRIHNAEPPFQTITIDFGWAVSVDEAITKVMGLFDGTPFDEPRYWFTLNGDAEARPELYARDVNPENHRVIAIYQNLSDADGTTPVPYGPARWQAYCTALTSATASWNAPRLFEEAVAGDDFVEALFTEEAAAMFGANLLTAIALFPKI